MGHRDILVITPRLQESCGLNAFAQILFNSMKVTASFPVQYAALSLVLSLSTVCK